jgi:hypothetical protein
MQRVFYRFLVGSSVLVVAFGAGVLPGCAKEVEPTLEELEAAEPRYNSSGSAILDGRPMDLDAAVRWAASNVEPGLAVVNITTPNPYEREYELVSVRDEPGWLLIRTPDNEPLSMWGQGVERLVALAKIGRFDVREQARERELLRALNRRLDVLAGME